MGLLLPAIDEARRRVFIRESRAERTSTLRAR